MILNQNLIDYGKIKLIMQGRGEWEYMGRMVHDVFLASPFEEFQVLRKVLNIEINKMASRFPVSLVDLNDGAVTHSPPVEECMAKARQSDFMILLMGDTYGSYAPNENKSYTQIEYESVIYKNSPTIVLVFCIGDSYKGKTIKYSKDENFKKFQQLVHTHHTVGYFSKEQSVEEIGRKIIQELLISVNTRVINGHMTEKSRVAEYDVDKVDVDDIKEISQKPIPKTYKQLLYKFLNDIYNYISDSIYKFLLVAGLLIWAASFIGTSDSSVVKYMDSNITEHNDTNITEDSYIDRSVWHCKARTERASGWVERVGMQNAIKGALHQCKIRNVTSNPCKIDNCYIVK